LFEQWQEFIVGGRFYFRGSRAGSLTLFFAVTTQAPEFTADATVILPPKKITGVGRENARGLVHYSQRGGTATKSRLLTMVARRRYLGIGY